MNIINSLHNNYKLNSSTPSYNTSFTFPTSLTDQNVNVSSKLASTSWTYSGSAVSKAVGTYYFSCSTFTAESLSTGYTSAYAPFETSLSGSVYWSGGQQSSEVYNTSNTNVSSYYSQQPFNTGTGNYQGTNYSQSAGSTTISSIGNISGEWIQISMPMAMKLSSIQIQSRNGYRGRYPANFYICGSTDGSTWISLLYNTTAQNTTIVSYPSYTSYSVNATNAYNYFRIVVTSIVCGNGNSSGQCCIVNMGLINLIGYI